VSRRILVDSFQQIPVCKRQLVDVVSEMSKVVNALRHVKYRLRNCDSRSNRI
jgi:hypothetical protein